MPSKNFNLLLIAAIVLLSSMIIGLLIYSSGQKESASPGSNEGSHETSNANQASTGSALEGLVAPESIGLMPVDYTGNPKLRVDDEVAGSVADTVKSGATIGESLTGTASRHVAGRLTNDANDLRISTERINQDGRLDAGVLIDNIEDRNVTGYEIGTKEGSVSYSEEDDTVRFQLKKKL